MGNNNSTRSIISNEKNEIMHKVHKDHSNNNISISSKQLQQNENSLNDFNLQSSLNTGTSGTSTLNEKSFYNLLKNQSFCYNMNHLNSISSSSSSTFENPGWDSSTSTLNNNNLLKNSSVSNFNRNNMNFMNFQSSTSTLTTVSDESSRYMNPEYDNSEMLIDNNYNPAIGHITNTFIVDEPDDISDITSRSIPSSEHDNDSEETTTLNPSLLFNSDEFYSLTEANVISLLQRDDIEINEIEIWNHIISWGIKNTLHLSYKNLSEWNEQDFEALKETLRDCIPWIRFFQIKPQEFADYVWPYKQILSKSIIGNFLRTQIAGHDPIMEATRTPPRIPSSDIDSIIMTGRHATILASWMQQEPFCGTIPFNFNLIYRSSKDGLSSKIFYEKCDDKGPTVLVVKLLNSRRIVGAYNPLSYQKSKISLRRRSLYGNKSKRNSSDYSDTCLNIKETKKESFLYSFQTRYYPEETAIISRIIPECSNEFITKHPYNSLCFGLGPDLRINLNENEKVGKVFPFSYQNPILNFEGTFKFEELEVFQVLKKREKDEW